jgi:hypothetical protein
MSCDEETLTSLVQALSCAKPAYCPPCVSALETALDALIQANTVRIAAIEDSHLTGSGTLDFPSIAAGDTDELTITVTGASVGDAVSLGPPAALESGLVAMGYVSASNTVTVRVHNTTAGAIDPASATWKASVIVIS